MARINKFLSRNINMIKLIKKTSKLAFIFLLFLFIFQKSLKATVAPPSNLEVAFGISLLATGYVATDFLTSYLTWESFRLLNKKTSYWGIFYGGLISGLTHIPLIYFRKPNIYLTNLKDYSFTINATTYITSFFIGNIIGAFVTMNSKSRMDINLTTNKVNFYLTYKY